MSFLTSIKSFSTTCSIYLFLLFLLCFHKVINICLHFKMFYIIRLQCSYLFRVFFTILWPTIVRSKTNPDQKKLDANGLIKNKLDQFWNKNYIERNLLKPKELTEDNTFNWILKIIIQKSEIKKNHPSINLLWKVNYQ